MIEATVANVGESYGKAWAAHDVDAIVALHTADSVFHVHGLGEKACGGNAIRLLVAAFLAQVPDLAFEHKRVYVGPDHLTFEYDMSGTAGDSAFVCDGVDVIAIRDGIVARKDTYLDLVVLERQIGGLPHMTTEASIATE
jgi:ketosteroid isomerase-like protein